jgi:hypothetical protein
MKKPVLFIRLSDSLEKKFQTIRTQTSVNLGKRVSKNKLIVSLIEERYAKITEEDPSPQSCETEMGEADELETPASELDTPPLETCTSEAHSA